MTEIAIVMVAVSLILNDKKLVDAAINIMLR